MKGHASFLKAASQNGLANAGKGELASTLRHSSGILSLFVDSFMPTS
jgi:hypothetical protein